MHIPDGFLTPMISMISLLVSGAVVAVSLQKTKKNLDERMVPFIALLTALFFAAQMMNYPVVGGTTAHLLGSAALAVLLGPYAACISMTIILVLQCLLFGDGGITAIGANLLTMAVIAVFASYYTYVTVAKATKNMMLGAAAGAFVGDVSSAVSAGTLLGLSTPVFQYGLSVAVPAMAINHGVIGAAEAVFTAVLVSLLVKAKPELVKLNESLRVAEGRKKE